MVHRVVGNQHPNQGVDDPAGAKDQGGDQEDDPVDDVGNRTNVTVELLLQVSGDDVNPPGGKAAVEAAPIKIPPTIVLVRGSVTSW